ncbi:MAG: hypothetical protein HP497_04095 [Nitrospira sp.]|nr:hypothetical protein [Nitrospira sp.]
MRARAIIFAATTLIVTGHSTLSPAGDLFTGFQMDGRGQYFSYLGARLPAVQLSGTTTIFVQATSAALGYSSRSAGQLVDSNGQFIVPSLGLSRSFGRWTVVALGGPQLRRLEEERLNASPRIDHQVGAYGQVEALYWYERGSLQAIGSYADLDNYFWGRLRGKLSVLKFDQGCCSLLVGWDVAGMGNADFRAVQTGPVIEVPIGKVFLLAKGGYEYSNSFHSGGYGGAELYVPF